ncbi:hypothetical protein [Phenylobacterium sp.]|uniref:hypothetical protein n=1 Tax=Phenylobacterium sp. TaxID=1871053 RepID=UPI0035B47BCF
MAEDPRTYQPSTTSVNRARMQGGGVGQQDMDMQQDPDRGTHATEPQRTEGWDNDPAGTGDDRGQGSSDMGAGAVSWDGANASGAAMEDRSFASTGAGDEAQSEDGGGERRDGMGLDPDTGRDEAGVGEVGDLGAGTPANVDIHKLGQPDKPEQEWGEPAEGATYSSTNTNRGGRTELERGQGAKTRAFNKDQFSRRT